MNYFNNQMTIEEGTQKLINIYQEWDQSFFHGCKKISIELNNRRIHLKMNKSKEFVQLIKIYFNEMHKDTSYVMPSNKKYTYAKLTLETISHENPITNEEALTFIKKIHYNKIKGLITLKNVKFQNMIYPGIVEFDGETRIHPIKIGILYARQFDLINCEISINSPQERDEYHTADSEHNIIEKFLQFNTSLGKN